MPHLNWLIRLPTSGFLLSLLMISVIAAAPVANAQQAPPSPCPNIAAECTQAEAEAAAQAHLAFQQAYYPPSRNPTLYNIPAEPGSEFAKYIIVWESGDYQQGTYHVSWYRATTFPGLPENPCGNWVSGDNCSRGKALAIANMAYEHKVLESPDGGWLVNLDAYYDETGQGYYCVRRTVPGWAAGCYFAVYFREYRPEHDESDLGAKCPEDCVSNASGSAQGAVPAAGNPINFGSGNKFQVERDVSGPGPGFVRYYNSDGFARADALGPHWTHTYSRWVSRSEVNGQGVARVARPDGAVLTFTNVAGSWVSTQAPRATLTPTFGAGGEIEAWTFKNRGSEESETFDSAGRLVRIDRRDGSWLELEHQDYNVNPPENILLRRVTDSNGRSLVFDYSPARQVSRITDSAGAETHFEYGSYGRLVAVERPDGAIRTYLYGETAHTSGASLLWALTGIVDENEARFATFKYDAQGRAISTEHAGGANLNIITYGASGARTVSRPTGSNSATQVQVINGQSVVTQATEQCQGCSPRTTTYGYDSQRRLTQVLGPNGLQTSYQYDAYGNRLVGTESTASEGVLRSVEWDWHSLEGEVEEIRSRDAAGSLLRRHALSYNARWQVTGMVESNSTGSISRSVSLTYCELSDLGVPGGPCSRVGQLKSIDGPRTDAADLTTFAYYTTTDETGCDTNGPCHRAGDRWKVTSPLGLVTEYARYDRAGRPTRVLDANGVATDLAYNARGWLVTRKVRGTDDNSESDDSITTLAYDAVGNVVQVTQPDGSTLAFEYDAAHRLVAVEDALGNRIEHTLDGAGQTVQEQIRDDSGTLRHSLSRVYDALGQLETLADAQANPTDFTYDAVGNVDTVTDALGRVNDLDHDPLGRLVQSIANVNGSGAERAVTGMAYDALDRLVSVTDPKGLTTQYTYDGLGNLVELDSPDTGVASYGYDAAGNRTSVLDARGVQRYYSYDALGRLTGVDVPTVGEDTGLVYDAAPVACQPGETFAAGRLASLINYAGTTDYCYDRRGNVARKVQAVANGPTRAVAYQHDLADRVSRITYPSGAVVTYQRDATGRISGVQVKRTPSTAVETLVSEVTYQPFGPLSQITFGNGRVLSIAHDQDFAVEAIEDSVAGGLSLGLTHDAVGNVVGIDERLNDGATASRGVDYDGLDRLTAMTNGASVAEGFSYDATGNRLSRTTTSTVNYTYPSDSHRLVKVGSQNRVYDEAGNSTSIHSKHFTYDDYGRMRQFINGTTLRNEYLYNGRGERVAKLNITSPGSTRYFVYDEAGRLLGEYNPAGTAVKEYVWLDDRPVAVLGSYQGHRFQYVLTDHLGTPRAVVNPPTNAIIWRWDLTASAFGSHARQANPDGDSANYVLNLRYPGQYYDGESGLHYNYFRDYDPATGRYVQSDPIGLGGGISTFGYVGSEPLNAFDPLGLIEWNGKIHFQEGHISVYGQQVVSYRRLMLSLESECVDGIKYKAGVVLSDLDGLGDPSMPRRRRLKPGSDFALFADVKLQDGQSSLSSQNLVGALTISGDVGWWGKATGRVSAGRAQGEFEGRGFGEIDFSGNGELLPFSMQPIPCTCAQ